MRVGVPTLGGWADPDGGATFRVWAPKARELKVRISGSEERVVSLEPEPLGYYSKTIADIPRDCDYGFLLDGRGPFPDPASRWQPKGVHGPSRLFKLDQEPPDAGSWCFDLGAAVIYELHVGAFTPEGTFAAAEGRLGELRELGVTAVELMPVAQFPGNRNWGYDGTYPFSVQDSYGGPAGLRRFVRAAHRVGLAVVLDVVYNHLGPEGNYLDQYGYYFTDRYRTPWGAALNFDGPCSDEVRRYFVESALQWQRYFQIDGLRLDAVHAICDFSAVPFLEELVVAVREQAEELGRPFRLIGESDLNMARHILPRATGGYGLDAQWSDDLHHCIHVLLTGERSGYYADFGGVELLGKTWREGYGYTGQYSVHRKHRHGSSPRSTSARQFVVCVQNHDQVGNRARGDRLSASLPPEDLRLGAAAVLFSPFVPLLFMGEEYGETAPFQYFVSHTDPELVEAVRAGRKEEFRSFVWVEPAPDPQDEATFQQSKLDWRLRQAPGHRELMTFYTECLRLRRDLAPLAHAEKDTQSVRTWESEELLQVRYWSGREQVMVLLHFGRKPVCQDLPLPRGPWRVVLDSLDVRWGGRKERVAPEFGADGLLRSGWGCRQALVLFAAEGGDAV